MLVQRGDLEAGTHEALVRHGQVELAGRLAAALGRLPGAGTKPNTTAAVERAWKVVTAETGLKRP